MIPIFSLSCISIPYIIWLMCLNFCLNMLSIDITSAMRISNLYIYGSNTKNRIVYRKFYIAEYVLRKLIKTLHWIYWRINRTRYRYNPKC